MKPWVPVLAATAALCAAGIAAAAHRDEVTAAALLVLAVFTAWATGLLMERYPPEGR